MNWLRLHVSNLCNFKCPNCHVFELGENLLPSQIMSLEVFNNSIDQVIKLLTLKKLSQLRISIYGGETLANKKVIKEGIKRASDLYKNLNLDWVLNTNGSLLKEEDAIFFKEYNVELHISVDGSENVHNLSRPTHVGKGTFHKVIEGIEIANRNNIKLQLNSYMMPTNFYHLNEIVDIAKKYSIPKIYLDQFYSEEMIEFEKGFELYKKVLHYGQLNNVEVFGPWKKVLDRKLSFRKRKNQLENNFLFDVNVDGTFYLSNYVESKKLNWKVTDLYKLVLEGKYNDLIGDLKQNREVECSQCELFDHCFGEAKEQVYYHINRNANTETSCKFYRGINNYLARPIYAWKNSNTQYISFYNENESEHLIKLINQSAQHCEIVLNTIRPDFVCKIVDSKEEFQVANKKSYPDWVMASTLGNHLILCGLSPSPAIRHEVGHIFIKNFKMKLPNWFEEGVCEWIDKGEKISLLKNKKKLSVLKRLLENKKLAEDFNFDFLSIDKPNENEDYIQFHSFVLYLISNYGKEKVIDFLKSEGQFVENFKFSFEIELSECVEKFLGGECV